MKLPYSKNDVEQLPIEIPNRVWKGMQSKNTKTQNNNQNKLWEIIREFHPTVWSFNINFKEPKLESFDQQNNPFV